MSTQLQKNLAKEIVKNSQRKKPLNKKELVVASGYSEVTASQQVPAVFEQKGVQDELRNLGFDIDSAKKVVKSILQTGKEENRLKAAQEIFKVEGGYAPEKSLSLSVQVHANNNETTQALADEYEEKIKAALNAPRTTVDPQLDSQERN